jgi:hypothetical protein
MRHSPKAISLSRLSGFGLLQQLDNDAKDALRVQEINCKNAIRGKLDLFLLPIRMFCFYAIQRCEHTISSQRFHVFEYPPLELSQGLHQAKAAIVQTQQVCYRHM